MGSEGRGKIIRTGLKVLLLLLTSFLMKSESLDIPEVTVYGDRKPSISKVKKELLPFEKDFIEPEAEKEIKDIKSFRIKRKKEEEKDMGIIANLKGGTEFEVDVNGFLRDAYYPVTAGISAITLSSFDTTGLDIKFSSSFRTLYLNGSLYKSELSDIYRIGGEWYSKFLSAGISVIYSDSLLLNTNLNINFQNFDIYFHSKNFLQNNRSLHIKSGLNLHPFYPEINWINSYFYPGGIYYLPGSYGLYIKASVRERITYPVRKNLINFYRIIPERKNYEYCISAGLSHPLPFSFFLSNYLSDSAYISDSTYAGVELKSKNLILKTGIPLENGKVFSSAFLQFSPASRTELDLWTHFSDFENPEFILGGGINFQITNNLNIGSSVRYMKKEDNIFEILASLRYVF